MPGALLLPESPDLGANFRVATLDELEADASKKSIVYGIDILGHGSAEAQLLKTPITSVALVREHKHTLYIAYNEDGEAIGLLKVGRKHLYYTKAKGGFLEIDPLCLLDFYVRPDLQRHGIGLAMFQHMLANEHVGAHALAYDRPSPKLLPFLRKHFGLTDHVDQPNRYVVFDAYFSKD
ncbi:Aste57867_25482 [Aphanomyces stellatus]|uniref:Alpha-tubulin N-acetyltransferase n=1 Tax=Aphanomyces stellatus TaxID=120398 RepID=A0A485LT96_9STRA|nr:hypothetical protein As57867_025403 [Aphanomyces stellatus]VFU02105.1 Aste57867_25482 [Aphanomyces stellatus]